MDTAPHPDSWKGLCFLFGGRAGDPARDGNEANPDGYLDDHRGQHAHAVLQPSPGGCVAMCGVDEACMCRCVSVSGDATGSRVDHRFRRSVVKKSTQDLSEERRAVVVYAMELLKKKKKRSTAK